MVRPALHVCRRSPPQPRRAPAAPPAAAVPAAVAAIYDTTPPLAPLLQMTQRLDFSNLVSEWGAAWAGARAGLCAPAPAHRLHPSFIPLLQATDRQCDTYLLYLEEAGRVGDVGWRRCMRWWWQVAVAVGGCDGLGQG